MATATWMGLDFEVSEISYGDSALSPGGAGVFVYARLIDGKWFPEFVGQANHLYVNALRSDAWPVARKQGCRHIHVLLEPSAIDRQSFVNYMLDTYDLELNRKYSAQVD